MPPTSAHPRTHRPHSPPTAVCVLPLFAPKPPVSGRASRPPLTPSTRKGFRAPTITSGGTAHAPPATGCPPTGVAVRLAHDARPIACSTSHVSETARVPLTSLASASSHAATELCACSRVPDAAALTRCEARSARVLSLKPDTSLSSATVSITNGSKAARASRIDNILGAIAHRWQRSPSPPTRFGTMPIDAERGDA